MNFFVLKARTSARMLAAANVEIAAGDAALEDVVVHAPCSSEDCREPATTSIGFIFVNREGLHASFRVRTCEAHTPRDEDEVPL